MPKKPNLGRSSKISGQEKRERKKEKEQRKARDHPLMPSRTLERGTSVPPTPIPTVKNNLRLPLRPDQTSPGPANSTLPL